MTHKLSRRPHYNLDRILIIIRYVKERCCWVTLVIITLSIQFPLEICFLPPTPCMHNNDTSLELTHFVIFLLAVKVIQDILNQRPISFFFWVMIKKTLMTWLTKSELTFYHVGCKRD